MLPACHDRLRRSRFVSEQTPSDKFMRIVLTPEKPVTTYDSELSEHRFLRDVWNRPAETTKNVQI
jgi:hypothetical protein